MCSDLEILSRVAVTAISPYLVERPDSGNSERKLISIRIRNKESDRGKITVLSMACVFVVADGSLSVWSAALTS